MKKKRSREASILKYVGVTDATKLRLPVDPTLPKDFWMTANYDWPESELLEWWNEPFIVTNGSELDVHCLDGGAWDRPTAYCKAASLEAARTLTMSMLQRWHATQPMFGYGHAEGGKVYLVRMARYPGDDELWLGPYANCVEASIESELIRGVGNPSPSY